MGGVVEGGVGIADKTSPRRAAIDKVQTELRQEYDFREKRKRELEFLEKGGDPLEFIKDKNAASVSVQSTSFTDQLPDQLTSEAKGSFALTASPHGDSVESSGRLGANPCEPNSADNLMLFDAEHEASEGDRNSLLPSKSATVPSEKLSRMDGHQRSREHGDSASFGLTRKAYKRRNRTRPNRDVTRSSSTDLNPTCGSHGSSFPSHHGPTEVKEFLSDAEIQNASSNRKSKLSSPTVGTLHKTGLMDDRQDTELACGKTVESTKNLIEGVPLDTASDAVASETAMDDQHNQQSPSGDQKTPIKMDSEGPKAIRAVEGMASVDVECLPSVTGVKVENLSSSCQLTGFSGKTGEAMKKDEYSSNASRGIKVLDSESSCTHTSLNIDGNNGSEMHTKPRNGDSNGKIKDQSSVPDGMPVVEGDGLVKEKKETEGFDSSTLVNMESNSAGQGQRENGFKHLPEVVLNQSRAALENKENDECVGEVEEACRPTGSELGRKPSEMLGDDPGPHNENSCNVKDEDSINVSISDLQNGGIVSIEAETSSGAASKVPRKIDDDSILKEARIIEAKRKRIAELSVAIFPKKIHPKSHWDYVLEEMAWLANDFAQERVWKIAAAAQIGTRAAFAFRSRKQENYSGMIAKKVANHLAKSVMEFWHSVEGTSKVVEQQSQRDRSLSVRAYALRFLEYTESSVVHQAEVPLTPDRLSDLGILELSWEDNWTEENLFYMVPPGAMEAYKNSIESCVSQCETMYENKTQDVAFAFLGAPISLLHVQSNSDQRIGSSLQEEVETSACDAAGEFESQDDVYYEDEGETNTYDMPMAFEGSRSSRPGQKKRKQSTHAFCVRPYDANSDMAIQHAENKVVAQQSALMGKRPGGSLNPLIPTKRVRTAFRRVTSPFSIGTIGCVPVPKADASSGDTNSFQDDHSTLRGGSLVPSNLEVDSVADFEKHLPFDSAEVSTKHKKKKKAKHLNAAYEAPWQVDPTFQNEQFQRDHWRKSHQVDSNGSSGLLGQPMVKKPKTMLQSQDNSFENMTPIGGSVPSPAASQMSNMSNPNKFMKMLGGRDRGRKPKVLKMPAGQACSGSPWTLFEDQALVVLAHDLGPNWELVSDVINSTMQFKCIFRKAKECKERHNVLMDITSGDGADSAEDSGSSQPYPSTLPGIPKGSARQLFQRLQGPMEEDTIKSHFEKIISIVQKQDYCRTQDLKLQQPHCSHAIALSQVCPNNLNGVPVLTPLDLCDATIPGCDALPLGYQGPHSGGLAFPSQGTATTMHPTSGASASQGSPNMMFCNNFSSSPGSLNSSVRDGRYGVPRSTSLSADEQRRSQQYNQMMAGRNVLQPNISASGAHLGTERGVRLLPGSNGVGLVCGANRNMPMTRPGFQGVGSASTANSGSVVSPGMSGANLHSGAGSGQGSSMLRPRETLNVMRPGLSQDSPRQMMVPDRQMQVSPGTSQGLSHFGGLSSPFPNQTASPPVSSYPLHHQPSHPISPQQPQVLGPHHPHIQGSANHALNPQKQAQAIRLAKESQQHRFLQQQPQQPQFASSSPLMPHVQPQSQLPVASPLQNSSQVLPQTCSPTVSLSPLASTSMNTMPQHQQKRQAPTQGVLRNMQSGGSGLTNQTSKQRQSKQQQFSQANRQHSQQRQHLQVQHPAKVAKGVGRGNLMTHQNVSIDPSLVNGATASPGNQFSEKEATTHLMQNQALYTSSALNTVQSTKQYVSSQSSNHNQSLPQLKIYSGQAASSTKQLHQLAENSNQGHVPPVAPGLPAGEPSSSSAMAGPNQQASSHQKLVNPSQSSLKRVIQPNHQINSDPSNKPQARDSDTDQPPTSSSAGMNTRTALPQANNNATNLVHANSLASAHQWHVSESHALNSATNLSTVVSVPSSESPLQVSQGLGQRLSSSSLPSIRHDPGAQWQQQRRPNSPVPQPQQHLQSLPPLHSQPQPHLLQAGNGNLYGENGDHRME